METLPYVVGVLTAIVAILGIVLTLKKTKGGLFKKVTETLSSAGEEIPPRGIRAVSAIAGYLFLQVAFALLFPKTWGSYWEDQTFFWVSQLSILVTVILISFSEGWWRWAIIPLLGVVLAVSTIQRIEETNEEKRKAAEAPATETEKSKPREVRQEVPSRQYGTWRLAVGPDWWTKEFCPPGGSYTSAERVDSSVGLNIRIKRPNGEWDLQKHPSGDEHLNIGAFKCLEIRGEEMTEVKITISRSPPS